MKKFNNSTITSTVKAINKKIPKNPKSISVMETTNKVMKIAQVVDAIA